jgi:hypothetical protein
MNIQSMRLELAKLAQKMPEGPQRAVFFLIYLIIQAFSVEMDNFYSLYTRFLTERVKCEKLYIIYRFDFGLEIGLL